MSLQKVCVQVVYSKDQVFFFWSDSKDQVDYDENQWPNGYPCIYTFY